MKKVLLTSVIALMTVSASAQVYVGGEVGAWRNWEKGANKSSITLLPEIGYNLDENLSIGTTIGWQYNYYGKKINPHNGKTLKVNSLRVAPYARYTFLKLDNVNLFLEGGFGFATSKVKGLDAMNSWEVGVKPGVFVNLTDKLSFVAHCGFFGYRTSDDAIPGVNVSPFGENGFGFSAKSTDLSFGLYWNF